MSISTLLRPAALALGIAACALPAAAQGTEVCHTDSIPLQLTNWSSSLTIPKFDPALGVLTGIRFELTGDVQGSARIENLDPGPAQISTSFQSVITLSRPDLSVLVITTPAANFLDPLLGFDGVVDFGGTSGITHDGIMVSETEITLSPPPLSDLALFTGPEGNPGTISLPVVATGTSSASGAGNLITQFGSEAGASVLVCYTYAPDCNGNGIPDAEDIASGTSNDHDGDGIPDECQPGITVFCVPEGPGGNGILCPCGNEPPVNTIEGCDHGQGMGVSLLASGVPSVANDTLMMTASQIPLDSHGFFFVGTEAVNGGMGTPFDSGLRCIDQVTPLKKFPPSNGSATLPIQNGPSVSMIVAAQPGSISYFQFWYRNLGGPCGGNANTSNGIQIVWGL